MRKLLFWMCSLLPLCADQLCADQSSNLALFAKGVFAEQKQDWIAARAIYQQALANDTDCYLLANKVATLQNYRLEDDPSFQDLPGATATLRTFAQNHRQHLPAQLRYATFLRTQAPNDQIARQVALETLELANENFPHTELVFSPLISLYEELEQQENSRQILNSQLTINSEDHRHWLALIPHIKTLYPTDSPDSISKLAITMAKVEEHGLHRADIARRVSEFHRQQGQIEKALATLHQHLAISPSSHSLRTRLGILYFSNNNKDLGEKTLLEVIAIDPDQILAHSSLAKFYTKEDQLSKALPHRAAVLRIRGGTPEEAITVADEYLALDEPHPARLLLEKFRFYHPESPGIHARLAIATLRDGLTTEAARLFRQAEALAETSKEEEAQQYLDADFQIEFAQSLIKAKDLPAAETRLRQAAKSIDLDTQPQKYSRTVTALAKLWLEQDKNQAPAKALLQRALTLDPDNQEAATLLK